MTKLILVLLSSAAMCVAQAANDGTVDDTDLGPQLTEPSDKPDIIEPTDKPDLTEQIEQTDKPDVVVQADKPEQVEQADKPEQMEQMETYYSPLEDGCWVQMYNRRNFGGNKIVFGGDASLSNMHQSTLNSHFYHNSQVYSLAGANTYSSRTWKNRVRSLEVGPGAELILYNGENYQGYASRVPAGSRIHNSLRLRNGHFDSFIVRCL